MNVYGEITKAQLENLGSDPAGNGISGGTTQQGRIWWRTDLKAARIDTGSSVLSVFTTLTAPTYSTATATGTGTGNFGASTTGYLFTISTSSTCAVGDTYHDSNSVVYTVLRALSAQSGAVLYCSQATAPASPTANLTRVTGVGTSTIQYTAVTALASYTVPANLLYAKITVVGGGGGAGSGNATGGSGGGGGGGTAIAYISAATMGVTQYYAVGPGVSGGTSGADGTVGVPSYFGVFATPLIGGGGGAGHGAGAATSGQGGSGGVGSGGTTNITGNAGGGGSIGTSGTTNGVGGNGGGSFYCGGAQGSDNTTGTNGTAYGGGGGGSSNGNAGGSGYAGYILVEEFYQ